MLFWLALLGIMNFVYPDKKVDIDGHPVEHDWYAPLPEPPEMYLRPELIPIKEPDGAAVEEAERVLRR